jgi:predicted nucleic-acid-binding Zn-ribbon protein
MPITRPCPNCGDPNRAHDENEFVLVRLTPDRSAIDLSRGVGVWAIACSSCGLVELYSSQLTTLQALTK